MLVVRGVQLSMARTSKLPAAKKRPAATIKKKPARPEGSRSGGWSSGKNYSSPVAVISSLRSQLSSALERARKAEALQAEAEQALFAERRQQKVVLLEALAQQRGQLTVVP